MNAKQLKDSILQYAIQGKLVTQDPNDESASELLKRISLDKERLIKEKAIKKEKPLPQITEEEKPFDVPDSWEWVRLNDLSIYIQRGKSPKYSLIEEIPVISQKCVQWTGFTIDPAKFVDPSTLETYDKVRLLQSNDILWNSTGLGTIGRVSLYDGNLNPYSIAVADSHVTVVRASKIVNTKYLYYYLASPTIQDSINDIASGSTKQKELNTSTIKSILVPLPPLEEQERIVEKIESLLIKIDIYNDVYTEVTNLTNEFPMQLEKSILQYAMQGKLVEQDLTDEPVQALIEEIKVEKERLIKEKVIKKEKPLPPITEEEIPFDVPSSWEWVRLEEISLYIQRGKSPKYSNVQEIPVISQKCIQWSGFNIEAAKFIEPSTLEKYNDIRFLKTNDILWNSTGLGTMGRVGIYDDNLNPYHLAVADSHVTVVRTSEFVDTEYIYYYLVSPTIQDSIEDIASGSTKQKELNTSTIKAITIPLPPYEEQKRIVKKIVELLSVSKKLTK